MSVAVRGRFRRSVHLARDFYADDGAGGYLVTAKAREVTARVARALSRDDATRAWSVTGPYGTGKSAFALFLAALLRGDASARALLDEADAALAERVGEAVGGAFCPVLLVGSREPLGPALLRALAHGLRQSGGDYEALASEADGAAETGDESDAIDLFDRAAEAVHAATGGGLLVVVDEMGKLLEHAALHPEGGDLFLLQRLAERASRPGAPLLLFTILHQAFERYAGRLGQAQRDEWQKVQGRFEDVAYVEPVAETLRLLAQAVEPDDADAYATGARALADDAAVLRALGAGAAPADVRRQLDGALPLHPAVALLVGPLFRRLAQNERSMFAFLASGEPGGFLDVVNGGTDLFDQAEPGTLYRLDHLYDYLVAGLGATLFSERMNRLWAETETALASLDGADALQVQLVKHVALLGFAGGLAGLAPTPATLALTTDRPADDVQAALDALREARALAYRPFGDEYHVWQGSDFDLGAALAEARAHVPLRTPLATLLTRVAPPTPVVARRHSYRTGATRTFDVRYASDETWRAEAAKPLTKTDGRIVYVLPERTETVGLIADLTDAGGPLTLFAVPEGVGALREAARDLACLDWVREHAEALQGDAAARREVAEQRATLAADVERQLAALLVADADGRNPCVWAHDGATFRVAGERALQERLSATCDEVFAHAPEVWNELLNRRKPSSSAVRGLKLLLDAMLHRADAPRLGIEGTPAEYGMYASVLGATGIHRPAGDAGRRPDGRWHLARPDETERPGCAAVWDAIGATLRSAQGQPVPVRDLYEVLSAPPYGVRPGLIPVFLVAFYKHAEDEVAFYENGTFVRDLRFETVERLLKSVEKGQDAFTMQYVEIDEARAEVLATLAPLLGLPASTRKPLPVAVRVLQRVHGLAPTVRTTARLSDPTLAAREALANATDPTLLLFQDLPRALGLPSFLTDAPDAERFAERLQDALRELGGAFAALLDEIEADLARAFGLHAASLADRRHELAARARALLPAARDLRLKAFLVRATDEILDAQAWLESLAALLVRRPPAQWSDEDRTGFGAALRETAGAFLRLEPLAADLLQTGDDDGPVRRVRLFVQTLNEREEAGVVHVHPEDDARVDALAARLADALDDDATADVKLAALGKLAADLLRQRDPTLAGPGPSD